MGIGAPCRANRNAECPHSGLSHPSHLDEEENSDVDNADEDDWDHKLEHSRENGVPGQGEVFWDPGIISSV